MSRGPFLLYTHIVFNIKIYIVSQGMKISVVIVGRNDNYGGTLNERATYCLNTMLDAFDEVIFVDWNTEEGKPPLTDVLDIKVYPERLKTIIVRPADVKRIMGDSYDKGVEFCQVIPRNIGIRRASGDHVVLAALDIIAPRRIFLEDAVSRIGPGRMLTVKRNHIDIEFIREVYKRSNSHEFTRDFMFEHYGVNSINVARMFKSLVVNAEILNRIPQEEYFNAASIIGGCGDFQIALKSTWEAIRGFEEDQIKRFYMDTEVQFKIIAAGGIVTASNYPPIYHIDHPRYFDDDKSSFNPCELYTTRNSENWGWPDENFEIKTCWS